MDRTPAVITMAEFAVFQPGMQALSVRTHARSFGSLNSVAGGGSGSHQLDVVGLAVAAAALIAIAHFMRKKI
jgi:hypothetical protein